MMITTSLGDLPRECLLAMLPNLAVQDLESLGATSPLFSKLTQARIVDDALWRSLAVKKWGDHIDLLVSPRITPGGWRQFCRHRMSSVSMPPTSPLNLLQESFPDPWAHIACCILCTRTTGGPTVRTAVSRTLTRWPTPSAVLDALDDELIESINPLGLQAVRLAALKSMSRDFLEKDWELPKEFKGCGVFCTDSYLIFCRGLRTESAVDDVNLKRYLRWLNNGETGEKKGKKGPSGQRGARRQRRQLQQRQGGDCDKMGSKGRGSNGRKARRDARQATKGLRRTTRSMAK